MYGMQSVIAQPVDVTSLGLTEDHKCHSHSGDLNVMFLIRPIIPRVTVTSQLLCEVTVTVFQSRDANNITCILSQNKRYWRHSDEFSTSLDSHEDRKSRI